MSSYSIPLPFASFLTERQVAEMLNVTASCLQKWRERKVELHQHQKFGDLVRYDPRDVESYIEQSRRPATQGV